MCSCFSKTNVSVSLAALGYPISFNLCSYAVETTNNQTARLAYQCHSFLNCPFGMLNLCAGCPPSCPPMWRNYEFPFKSLTPGANALTPAHGSRSKHLSEAVRGFDPHPLQAAMSLGCGFGWGPSSWTSGSRSSAPSSTSCTARRTTRRRTRT